ncbi:hypothetical protein I7X12_05620 [Halosimplex litoreum]|uniref:Uncharacterized protein n=1 Tax=Halosimplex litoreum TaxID=1198301 RepID=A0A7T3KWG0_9EURY|nr:hypothetical protein [Halosimplex litoreum]QPV64104.1 hypothetical protein I7X12_05620 [Halosimplex litoreum]
MPDGTGGLGAAVGLGSTGGGETDEPSPSSIGGTDGIDLRDIEMDWSDVDQADPEIGGGYGKNEMTWDRVEGYGRSSLEAMETDEIKDVVDFVKDEGGEEIIAESIDAYGGPDAEDYVSEGAKKTASGVISGDVLGGVASAAIPR